MGISWEYFKLYKDCWKKRRLLKEFNYTRQDNGNWVSPNGKILYKIEVETLSYFELDDLLEMGWGT